MGALRSATADGVPPCGRFCYDASTPVWYAFRIDKGGEP